MQFNKEEIETLLSIVKQTKANTHAWCEQWLDNGGSFYDKEYRLAEANCDILGNLMNKLENMSDIKDTNIELYKKFR